MDGGAPPALASTAAHFDTNIVIVRERVPVWMLLTTEARGKPSLFGRRVATLIAVTAAGAVTS
jgi:hypothetical protein